MIKVQCYSGYKVNERPIAFCLSHHTYKVEEIIDRWYGDKTAYFKIRADDENIYLLKYDEWCDQWDLVFYQNPKKVNVLMPHYSEMGPILSVYVEPLGNKGSARLN